MEPSTDNLRSLPWYAIAGTGREGPLTADQMLEHFRQGRYTATTLVWCSAFTSWVAASAVPLFSAFAPPPVTAYPPPFPDERGSAREGNGRREDTGIPGAGPHGPGASPGPRAAGRRPRPRTDYLHPWHRAFARFVDWNVVSVPVYIALSVMAPDAAANGLTLGFLSIAATTVFDGFCWAGWGTTPGKKLFGIRVLTQDGERLAFAEAFRRARAAWINGAALGVPLANLFVGDRQLRRLLRGESASYDEGAPWRVDVDELPKQRQAIASLVVLGVLALNFWGRMQG